MTQIDFHLETSQVDNRPIFISGTFNNWCDNDPLFRMQKVGEKSYLFRLETTLAYPFAYHYHKGDRDQGELDEWGNVPAVRKILSGTRQVSDLVPRWKINGMAGSALYMPKKFMIEDDFEIPQLKKRRRIWALLPPDYYYTKDHYPVLYLQDAQNLFNEDAPFGNWAIDEKLSILKELGYGDIIIIAVEHGDRDRIKEYSPFETKKFGAGEGKLYARFIVNTLKPYVDSNFKTRTDRKYTGIGGSSMGGLISLYTAMTYPKIFSKWMIFSPSLWLTNKIFTEAKKFSSRDHVSVYLFGGKKESATMEKDLTTFATTLRKKINDQNIEYKLSIDPEGTHTEACWGAEFPKAVKWLFFKQKS